MLSTLRLGAIAALALSVAGCGNAVDKINEHLQAAKGELQAKRAISVSQDGLKDLKRVDIALAVRAESLAALKPKLLGALNASEKIKAEQIAFQDIELSLDSQVLSLAVSLTKKVTDYTVSGQLQVSSFVGATANALVWNLYLDGIKVTKVEGASKPTEQAIKLIADAINAARPVVNAVLDDVVNDSPDKALMLSFDKKDLIRKELSEESTDDFKIDRKELAAGLQTQATAVLIDNRGIFVIAQLEFVKPEAVQPKLPAFPKDADLVRMSMPDWKQRVDAYRQAVTALAGASDELQLLAKLEHSGMAVTREALARLVNFLFSQGDITGTMIMNKPMKEEKSNLTLEIKRRDCKQYFDGCDFKHVCEGNNCTEQVDEVINKTCKVSCCLQTGLLGCVIPGLCDRACNEIRKVSRPIQSPTCDGFRAASALHGGLLCNVASKVSKAACDVEANVRKSFCDVEQEVARFYEKNPIATVTANAKPDARFSLKVSDASAANDLSSLHATVSGSGGGKVHASIKYDRHNYADALVLGPGMSLGAGCAVDWKESVDIDVTAQPLAERLTFAATASLAPDRTAVLEFKQQGKKMVKADFDPPPLQALFIGKPHVTLNCPLAALGAVIFGTAEGIFKEEDARKVLPLLTGKGYPHELKDLKFSLKLKPINVCDSAGSCDKPLLTLDPDIRNKSISYLERRS